MNILPILKALGPVVETAAQLLAVSRAMRKEQGSSAEEIAALERLAEQQAATVNALAAQVAALAGQMDELSTGLAARDSAFRAEVAALQRRSNWTIGLALAALSLAVTAGLVCLRILG